MKYIFMILLVILICFIGSGLSKYYIDRYKFFVSFLEFLQNYKSNINFEKNFLSEFISNTKSKNTNNDFIKALNDFDNINKNKIYLIDIKFLNSEEKEKIKNIFLELGKADYATEIIKIDQSIEYVNGFLDKTKIERDKYAPMAFKLSLLFGLAIAILFL